MLFQSSASLNSWVSGISLRRATWGGGSGMSVREGGVQDLTRSDVDDLLLLTTGELEEEQTALKKYAAQLQQNLLALGSERTGVLAQQESEGLYYDEEDEDEGGGEGGPMIRVKRRRWPTTFSRKGYCLVLQGGKWVQMYLNVMFEEKLVTFCR